MFKWGMLRVSENMKCWRMLPSVSGQMSIFNKIFCATRFCVSLFRPIVPPQSNWRAPWSGEPGWLHCPQAGPPHTIPPHNDSEERPAVRAAVTPGSWPLTQIWGQRKSGPAAEEQEKCWGGWVGKASGAKHSALPKTQVTLNVTCLQVIQMLEDLLRFSPLNSNKIGGAGLS